MTHIEHRIRLYIPRLFGLQEAAIWTEKSLGHVDHRLQVGVCHLGDFPNSRHPAHNLLLWTFIRQTAEHDFSHPLLFPGVQFRVGLVRMLGQRVLQTTDVQVIFMFDHQPFLRCFCGSFLRLSPCSHQGMLHEWELIWIVPDVI
jgi:hypothetical protein